VQQLIKNEQVEHSNQSKGAAVDSHRYDRLLVLIDAHGVPQGLDFEAFLRHVPHRQRVGLSVGVRPARTLPSQDWAAKMRSACLDVVAYDVPGGLTQARRVSCLEIHVRAMQSLYRDKRIDGVLIVCPTFSLGPLARAIHDAGCALLVADVEEFVGLHAGVVDGAFVIDSFILAVQP